MRSLVNRINISATVSGGHRVPWYFTCVRRCKKREGKRSLDDGMTMAGDQYLGRRQAYDQAICLTKVPVPITCSTQMVGVQDGVSET